MGFEAEVEVEVRAYSSADAYAGDARVRGLTGWRVVSVVYLGEGETRFLDLEEGKRLLVTYERGT